MRIVCAESVLHGRRLFDRLGDVAVFPDDRIDAAAVRDADALVIRSKTPIRRGVLDGTAIRIVGTATAGIDHLDLAYLADRNIAWTAATGCNANSVSEYVVAALLVLMERHGRLMQDLTLGVIGVGQVGSRVMTKAQALGMRVLCNDPPRRLAEPGSDFVDLEELLAGSDAVTLHVPWTVRGPFPTDHLANSRFFAQLRPGALFVNTCRGGVVNSDALRTALDRGVVRGAALDVWEGEPDIPVDLVERIDVATAHIAGHSFEGKLNGSLQVFEQLCRFFEVGVDADYAEFYPPWDEPPISLDDRGRLPQDVIHEAVRHAYSILEDDRSLRVGNRLEPAERRSHFRALRSSYRLRREFNAWTICSAMLAPPLTEALSRLGFRVASHRDAVRSRL